MKKLVATCAFALAAPLFAHDFWIEPATFRPDVGATVALALRVGQGFRGDPVPLQPDRVVKFVTIAPSGAETSAAGVPGRDPAGRARITEPGYVLVAYRSNPASLELPADKFEAYLKEEGLEKIIEARAATRRSRRRKSTRAARRRCSTPEAPGPRVSTASSVSGWSSFPKRARRNFRAGEVRSMFASSSRGSRSRARSSSR